MKKRDVLNCFSFQNSRFKLKAPTNLESFDDICNFSQSYVGRGNYNIFSLHKHKEEFLDYYHKTVCYVEMLGENLVIRYKYNAFKQNHIQHKYGLGIIMLP